MLSNDTNNYFNSYSSLEPNPSVKMNGDGRTLSAPDIARNNVGGKGGVSAAARRRMEDRMFTRQDNAMWWGIMRV